jgi:hypothetical protein
MPERGEAYHCSSLVAPQPGSLHRDRYLPTDQPEPEKLRAAGTEGGNNLPAKGDLVVPLVVPIPSGTGRGLSVAVGSEGAAGDKAESRNPLQDKGFDGTSRKLSAGVGERPLPDSNRGWRICNLKPPGRKLLTHQSLPPIPHWGLHAGLHRRPHVPLRTPILPAS